MHHEQQINKKGGISLSKVLTDNLFAYLLAVLISHRKWQYIIPYKSGIFITLFRWSVPQIRLSNQLIWTRFQSKLTGLYYIILYSFVPKYRYRTRAIITRSRFETALEYKPRIFKVKKVSLYYKPLCIINRGL